MRSAARSALAGSSSCTRGTPNAAMIASPMNFSTVPPSASISARMAAKKAPMTSFSASASSRSPSAVEPVMSANSTVTTLRSSTAAVRSERELGAAAVAEARLAGILAPAARADRHVRQRTNSRRTRVGERAVTIGAPMLRKDAKIELLRHVTLFSGCSKKELGQIALIADEIDFPAGKTLITQGEPGRQFFVVDRGRRQGHEERQELPAARGGSEFYGEISLVSGSPATATVTTVTPTRALVIAPQHFRALLDRSPVDPAAGAALVQRAARAAPDLSRGAAREVQVVRVDVYGYDLTYVHGTYVMSGGREIVSLPSTVVRVTADDGTQGFGETCPLGPAYLPAHGEGARAALRELGPALLGLDPRELAIVNDTLDAALLGHAYAKSAIDVACWDLLGKVDGPAGLRPARRPPAGLLSALRRDPARAARGDGRARARAPRRGHPPLPAQARRRSARRRRRACAPCSTRRPTRTS